MRRHLLIALLPALLLAADPGPMRSTRLAADPALTADPAAPHWQGAPAVFAETDPFGHPLPEARTEIRSRWSNGHLYFLFIAPYETLYPRPNPEPAKEAWGLWEYDVAEVFLGEDFENINLYREFEVSPDGEFIDLDVDHAKKGLTVDWKWNSGLRYKTRIDRDRKIWYCEMQIPWKALSARPPAAGREFRINLYRIEGGPKNRKYIVWRQLDNKSFHTPERFGRLRLD